MYQLKRNWRTLFERGVKKCQVAVVDPSVGLEFSAKIEVFVGLFY